MEFRGGGVKTIRFLYKVIIIIYAHAHQHSTRVQAGTAAEQARSAPVGRYVKVKVMLMRARVLRLHAGRPVTLHLNSECK